MPINHALPYGGPPNAAVYPFWDDLVVDASAQVRTAVVGQAPHRGFVVEWHNVLVYKTTQRLTFAATLGEDGRITLQYQDLPDAAQARGGSATVGVENADGTIATQYSANQATLAPGMAIAFHMPGRLVGTVTGNGHPLADAQIEIDQDGWWIDTATTDAAGHYLLALPYGQYTLEVSSSGYAPTDVDVTVPDEGDLTTDVTLTPYS
jgi:hypothetical protein